MTNEKINIAEVIADAEGSQAIMYEQSKGINAAALEAEIKTAKESADAILKARGIDSWALFTDAESMYMSACVNAIDSPLGRRF